jgi:hypothetical protein
MKLVFHIPFDIEVAIEKHKIISNKHTRKGEKNIEDEKESLSSSTINVIKFFFSFIHSFGNLRKKQPDEIMSGKFYYLLY